MNRNRYWRYSLCVGLLLVVGQNLALCGASPPRRFALLVGIDKYESDKLAQLSGAVNDVRAIRTTLIEKLGTAREDILCYVNDPEGDEREPTLGNILDGMRQIAEVCGLDDEFILYWASHGYEVPSSKRDAGATYLLTTQSYPHDPRLLRKTALARDELEEYLNDIQARRILIVMGICRDQPFVRMSGLPRVSEAYHRGLQLDLNKLRVKDKQRITATIMSCSPGEVSYEVGGRCIFGTYFQRGLEGAAVDEAGRVTLSSLYQYLVKIVPKEAQKNVGDTQTPWMDSRGSIAEWVLTTGTTSAPDTVQPPPPAIDLVALGFTALAETVNDPNMLVKDKIAACEGFLSGPGANSKYHADVEQWLAALKPGRTEQSAQTTFIYAPVNVSGVRYFLDRGAGPTMVDAKDGQITGVKPGSYTLRIEHPDYDPYETSITVKATGLRLPTLKLVPNYGSLTIAAEPPNATIRLDGTEIGKADPQLEIAKIRKGQHEVQLILDGYETAVLTATVKPGERARVTGNLIPLFGTLTVSSDPLGATVLLDGKSIGVTPLTRHRLSPATYSLKLQRDGFYEQARSAVVTRAKEMDLGVVTLTAKMGKVQITSSPPDATVTIDQTKLDGATPLIADLPVGKHTIQLTTQGMAWSQEVAVEADKLAVIHGELESLTPASYTNSLGMVMVLIPAGGFTMGSPDGTGGSDEHPAHTVKLTQDFYLADAEVTKAQFAEFVSATGYKTTAEQEGSTYIYENESWTDKKGASWRNPGFTQTEDQPVVCVSWYDAVEFCNWLSEKEKRTKCYTGSGDSLQCNFQADGYRLPTEAEWEYACRAGTTTKFSFGNDEAELKKYGNSGETGDGYERTAPVRSFQPNPWNLYDMHGNVWEWCWDWYESKAYQRYARDGYKPPQTGSRRVLRGGSWYNAAQYCRAASRNSGRPAFRNGDCGFRLARSLP